MVMADKISLRNFCPGLADKKFLCLASSYSKSESDSNLRWLTGNEGTESSSDCLGVADEIHCKYHTKISLLQEINSNFFKLNPQSLNLVLEEIFLLHNKEDDSENMVKPNTYFKNFLHIIFLNFFTLNV